jgi:hydroxyethylthiazole kinase-like sugar kinase family protein
MVNMLLATGASSSMVQTVEEIREFTALSNALCIKNSSISAAWIFSVK